MKRKQSLEVYEQRYKILKIRTLPFACFYCGEMAENMDHCPPISRVDDYMAYNLLAEMYLKVPCCGDCNVLLGNKLNRNLEDRIEMLKNLLETKNKKLLKSVIWTKERVEDAELKGKLRKYIVKISREQKRIIDRLNFYEGLKSYRDYLLEIY